MINRNLREEKMKFNIIMVLQFGLVIDSLRNKKAYVLSLITEMPGINTIFLRKRRNNVYFKMKTSKDC